jgi:hypothetical protein
MVDGLNFKDFVSFLSTFSARASLQQKIECNEKSSLNSDISFFLSIGVHDGYALLGPRYYKLIF